MLQRISTLLSITVFAILMTACEGETTYTKNVTNTSGDTISLLIYTQWEYIEDSVVLYPNTSKTIFIFSILGGTDTPILCVTEFDSIIVNIEGEKLLTKDIMNNNNWNYRIEPQKNGRVVDHYCNFIIREEDIQ